MTASEAIKAYTRLVPALSVKPTEDDGERGRNTEAFKEAFMRVLKDAGCDSETPMIDDDAPKTIVVVSNVVNSLTPHFIRSYRVRGAPTPPCSILQAACACIASPNQFLPVIIGDDYRNATLVDAIAGYANPTKESMREVQSLYGEEATVSTILSLGAGNIGSGVSSGSHLDELTDILKRGVTVCEQVHEDMQRRLSDTLVYFRFNVEKKMGAAPETISAHTSAYLQRAAVSRRLDEAAKSIHSCKARIELKDINSVATVKIQLKPRPSLVPNFVGREDVLRVMHEIHLANRLPVLRTPAITVLSGLGGSGKTQIALRFAVDFEELCPDKPVYFLNAESEESLKADYENLIRSLGMEHRSKSDQDALVWLSTKLKNWLIILDNADNPKVPLFSYIPKSTTGNIIITTRNSNHATLAPNGSHHIEGLPELDSVDLILKSSGYENTKANQAIATQIVRELGNLPLALAQAAGYIFVNKCLSRYLDIYRKSAVKMLASFPSQRPEDYRSSVARTIEMSLDRLPQEAQDLMHLFAHLGPTSIPYCVIAKAARQKFEHVTATQRSELDPQTLEHANTLREIFYKDGEWSEFEFNELIAQCLQYSLLQITTQGEDSFYSIHILVRSYLKASLPLIRAHQSGQLVVRLLGSSFTFSVSYEYLAFNRLLLPHLRLIQLGDIIEAGDHFGFGQVFYEMGDWKLAIAHQERCVEIWKASLGDEDDNTLSAMTNLSNSYRKIERKQEAVELNEQLVASRRKVSGLEHPSTLVAMHNLAASYFWIGRKEEAMGMEEQVLELRKRILGPENPLTLSTMSNLADSYAGFGRLQDALKMEEEVLDLRRKVLGPEHPDTLVSIEAIANLYSRLGREQEALASRENLVELRTKVLGLEHPDTAEAMWNLGYSLRDIGLKERLLELSRNAMPVYERVLGLEDEKTIWARKELTELQLEIEGLSADEM